MNSKEMNKLLAQVTQMLHEHLDVVQIMVSHTIEDNTFTAFYGTGNWHARIGLAHEFIKNDDAQRLTNQLSNIIPRQEPPDAGEEWKNDV